MNFPHNNPVKAKEIIAKLEAVEKQLGEGESIGMGCLFWFDIRNYCVEQVKINGDRNSLAKCEFGSWRGHKIFLIPGSISCPDGNTEPRPVKPDDILERLWEFKKYHEK